MYLSQEEQTVRLIADQKAVELGFDPETPGPEVFRELRPHDHPFLDEEGIEERDSLWAVNYAPPSTFVLEGQLYATAGGDLTVYGPCPITESGGLLDGGMK